MTRKQIHLTLLPSLFFFALAHSAQPHTAADEFTKQGIKQASQVLGTQTNDLINYVKEQYGIVTPLQAAQQKNMDAQIKLSEKQMELNEQQKILNDKQIELAEKQIEDTTLDAHIKKLAAIKETCSLLPRNDPKALEAIKRSKAKLDDIIKDFPPLPEEETKPSPESPAKKIDDIKAKNSLFTLITTPFIFAATKTGKIADTIADYSFAYVTNLECLKGSFIDKHHIGINRALVATTVAVITYSAYKLYKAKTYVDNDDDIFNDDNDY